LGFSQCLNNSLTSKSAVELTEIPAVKIMNPLTEDMTRLRTTLLEGLIKTVDYNIKNGNENLRLYEWGNVFTRKKPGLAGIRQQELISGIIHGEFQSGSIHNAHAVQADFFILKGLMEHLFNSLKIKGLTIVSNNDPNSFYSSTYSFYVDHKLFGTCGKLSGSFINNLDFESGPLFAFELFLDLLFNEMEVSPRFTAPNLFPKIERDLNFVVDDTLETGKIVELIRKNGRNILIDVKAVNIFKKDELGTGKKSITFNLVFQSDSKTLEDKDVSPVISEIVRLATKQLQAKLR
ncbi:MAG: hypothetical protein V3S48_05940, partial [Candidatus Neomarinimicrobiota bacterium]